MVDSLGILSLTMGIDGVYKNLDKLFKVACDAQEASKLFKTIGINYQG
jgi:hypothetical protein